MAPTGAEFQVSVLDGLRVLAVTPVSGYGGFNTSVHRIKALESLGCRVEVIDSAWVNPRTLGVLDYRLRNRLFGIGLPIAVPDLSQNGASLLAAVNDAVWDVIWLERALHLGAEVLKSVHRRCPDALVIGFSPDDMCQRHNQSQQFLEALPFYDAFLTTKSYNVSELGALGCPEVCFVGNGYDPDTFRPIPITPEDRARLGGEVGFIGSYEAERAAAMHFLASNGLRVRVWGGDWTRMRPKHPRVTLENVPLYGDDFARACAATKINLGFLRKLNRDLQTTRSVEIPACGGFMLAERTAEHLELFKEGEEAEFFESPRELLEKCLYYLAHPEARERIALAGHERCQRGSYSNAGRLAAVLPGLIVRARANSRNKSS